MPTDRSCTTKEDAEVREQGPHDVTLSQRERQVLREIETQLRREGRVFARAPRSLRSVPVGWAAALLTVGAVVMFLSALAVSLVVALVGGLLMVAGLTLSCLRLAPLLVRWLRRNTCEGRNAGSGGQTSGR